MMSSCIYTPHLSVLYTTTYYPSSCNYLRFRLGEPWGCLESRPRLAWQNHATRLSLKLPEQLSSTLCCNRIRTANFHIESQIKYHCATDPSPETCHPAILDGRKFGLGGNFWAAKRTFLNKFQICFLIFKSKKVLGF